MNRFLLPVLLSFGLIPFAFAQSNTPPVSTSQIAGFTEYQGAPAQSLDLNTYFQDPDMTAAIRMTTVQGTMDLALFDRQKPITANNFLRYINDGRYFAPDPVTKQQASSFIHRSISTFVLQGGGFIGTGELEQQRHPADRGRHLPADPKRARDPEQARDDCDGENVGPEQRHQPVVH